MILLQWVNFTRGHLQKAFVCVCARAGNKDTKKIPHSPGTSNNYIPEKETAK